MKLIDEHKSFGGWQRRYQHASSSCHCDMTFSLYLPPQAASHAVPVVYWLSGLTCTDQNFVTKAGAQRMAAELGLALVAPDTSPRGAAVADDAAYDLGQGAGFYVNATVAPWADHYQMYDYVVTELPALLDTHCGDQLDLGREAIAGHSMGGHGALVIGLRNPQRFRAIAAFAAICAPTKTAWGQKALHAYLGSNNSSWQAYDATCLIEQANTPTQLPPIRLDQGDADEFLDTQLAPERLKQAADRMGAKLTLHYHQQHDHSYFFIASFIDEQLKFIARQLG